MSGKQKPIDLEPVLQWIRDNSIDGIGPARSMYHSAAAAAGLPSYSSLQLRKWTWPALCKLAGVERRQVGRPPQSEGPAFLRRFPGAIPATVEEEIQQMHDNAEPPQPRSWPLFGIPTRTETFTVRISDDTAIRCTRQYFSICAKGAS